MIIKFILGYLALLVLVSTNLSAQSFIVRDKETKNPIPYVNIYVVGENAGTTANQEGVFILPPFNTDKVLIFSALGFEDIRLSS